MSQATDDKVSRYAAALKMLQESERRVNTASCELANATNDLIKHLLPKRPDEKMVYGIWVNGAQAGFGDGDVLVRISKEPHRDWKLEVDNQRRTE